MRQILPTLFALLLCANTLIVQQSPTLSQKVSRLLDVINENHLQPKKVDASFVGFLDSTFLQSLDPGELIFKESDVAQFKINAEALQNGLRMNSESYVDTVSAVWMKRASKFLL